MRRTLSAAAALACAVGPLLAAAPASAATSGTTAQSWYWAEQAGTGPAPVGAPSQASGVPDGDLGVAFTTDVDKVTALGLGTPGAPAGARYDRYALTLSLDPDAQQLANGTPQLVACRALDPVVDGAKPGPLADAPPVDTVVCIDGKADAAGKAYTFELAGLATDWAAGTPQDGVVVRPKAGDSTPFSYAFLGGAAVKVDSSYTLPAPTAAAASPAAAGGSTGSTGGTGSTDGPALQPASGVGDPVAPGVPGTSVPDVAPAPALDSGALPGPAPAVVPVGPEVATPQVPAAAPALALRPVSDLTPSPAVWVGGLVLAALLAAVSLVLGDPLAPLPLDGRRRRFADVVRARAGSGTAAATVALRPA